ncbi:MAG: signal peptidase I [Xanthomonadales bacterium]|nr:signal peptidase I [Xanthomonadales bacterium]
MNFDFAKILTIITLVAGTIWLLDKLFLKRRRTEKADQTNTEYTEPMLVEWSVSLFPVLLLVLVVRSFIFEPFKIPTGSMIPTLHIGDFIAVNKSAYGLRLPVLNTKIFDIGEPKRGDVAVFRYPPDPSINYIKRVIGLPGDKIVYRNKHLFINGEPASLEAIGRYLKSDTKCGTPRAGEVRFKEILDGVEHDILIRNGWGNASEQIFTVPEGMYFMMGDNRDNSLDSRAWGFVPEENLMGRATYVWMSFDSHACIDRSRIGEAIQ